MQGLIIAGTGAAAVIALTLGLWLPLRSREVAMRRRIEGFVDAGTGKPGAFAVDLGGRRRRRASAPLAREDRPAAVRALEARIVKAQVDLTARDILTGVAIAACAVLVGVTFFEGPVVGISLAACVPALALLWLAQRARSIQRRFSDQLADTVSLLAGSVRVGHSVQQALEHVAHEAPEPTRSAFALAVREIGLGASMEQALGRLVERYPSDDLELVTTAINVHASTGGSLARVLDVSADTIRERVRMEAEVKALTSQQRYSAYVLALLPVFTLIGLKLISPDYADELFKPGGLRIALIGAAVLVASGFYVMRRMASIDE